MSAPLYDFFDLVLVGGEVVNPIFAVGMNTLVTKIDTPIASANNVERFPFQWYLMYARSKARSTWLENEHERDAFVYHLVRSNYSVGAVASTYNLE